MRLFLQQHPRAGEPPRHLQLTLQSDLLAYWELSCESGQIGSRSQLRRAQYSAHSEALAAFEKARDPHLRRGFQEMALVDIQIPERQ